MKTTTNQKNYTGIVVILTLAINGLIALLFFMPKLDQFSHLDVTFLPLLNAVLNSFTFIFLLAALFMIKQRNITVHKRFVLAAFTTTFFFLLSYVTYHALAESTHFGADGLIMYGYYFILISHILLSIAIVPMALITLFRGLNRQDERHRKIARWTMPMWLYVSLTGVIVYLMISPYY
ncbi:DUF420 domain-containing protein [Halobacillus naozhouensis]|uniref:DUF420 domain-containing protein n=1 Tax=Halobacillus naozhouensis TaxID=554880 RepID=A0ABY8J055_9BACI|nr:DUF420 domain-containing protein [Halobacillus naozhouensis]WFT75870.1 DUF420 domain-containing protein [Halobacillus naozhouensis]